MDNAGLRKWILKSLKLNGYTVRADAAAFLAAQMQPIDPLQRNKWMSKITERIPLLNLKSMIIDRSDIVKCLEDCTKKESAKDTAWNVMNIFEAPCFTFNIEANKFVADKSPLHQGLFPAPRIKSQALRKRYALLLQRTLRHNLFKEHLALGQEKSKFSLKKIEWFLCSSGRVENAVILGLLVRKSETQFDIEDLTGSLRLDLSNTKFHDGLFPEHSFVLVEGSYEDKVLYVTGVGLPPAEIAKQSRPYFGNANTFGGSSETNLTLSPSLLKLQNDHPDAMIVFLSDVWLDNIKVVDKLRVMFNGFAEHPPYAFVLLGNFLSASLGATHGEELHTRLKILAELIASVPSICENSNFVLVPGPTDPGSPMTLPRSPLPEYVTKEFTSVVKKSVMATNPCRIQYCTREIIVFREDIVTKMCRNTIHFPTSGDIHIHFAKSIVSQATLVPLSFNVCPVYWSFSHCLELYPLPDLVLIGDQFNSFSSSHMDCNIVNSGSFVKSGFSFRVYLPQTNQVEESVIPDED